GKSAALGQQQEQGTYVPNTSITLSGEIGETAALKTTTSQYFYGYSVSVVTGYHINDETYCYYDNWSQTCTSILTKFLRPQNTSKTYTVTINSGSGETRPVNKSVRYLIRAQ
ncbi:MAG: hypothetical protein J6M06_03675, partial [Synergistaceae bacterium]|nr:hypothetical protein [Synergistaceae bacterium]